MMRPIVIFNKEYSCLAERYLSGMLYMLNNNSNFALDYTPQTYIRQISNPEISTENRYFIKILQDKNEGTQDI